MDQGQQQQPSPPSPQAPLRYWCHSCQHELGPNDIHTIDGVISCKDCASEFVEIVSRRISIFIDRLIPLSF